MKRQTTPLIEDGAVVVFQGDSITDAARHRSRPLHLGRGYAMIVAALFHSMYPERNVTFLNRGVSGDTTKDLSLRWQEDCIDLKPTWVSLLAGINDCWRRYDQNDPTPVETFAARYRELLIRVQEETGARIILGEPFLLPVSDALVRWREDLDPKIHAVRRLAREFDALLIPYDGLFAAASTRAAPSYWAEDGVHPTEAGHGLMARAWLSAVGGI